MVMLQLQCRIINMANGYLMMSQLLSQSLHQTTQCAWSANQSSFPCTCIMFWLMRIWFFKQWRFLECIYICMPVATEFLFHAILFFCSDCGVFSMKNFVPQFHSQYILYYLSRKSSQLVSLSFTTTGAHQFHNQFYLNMNTPQLVSL